MQVKMINDLTEYSNFSLTSIVIGELNDQYIVLNINWEEWEDTTNVYLTVINKEDVGLITKDIEEDYIIKNLLLLKGNDTNK